MNKENIIHTYNRISLAFKKKETPLFAITWKKLRDIILSKKKKPVQNDK
jgi:hypothetical protein